MTTTIKKNKALRIFTFILVSVTIVGGIITLFLNTEYAKAYQLFIKRSYKKITTLYESLTPEQKQALKHYATKAVHLSKNEVIKNLVKIDKVDLAKANKIVAVGSSVIKEVIKKVERKIK